MFTDAPKRILCIHDLSGAGRSSLAVVTSVLAVMGHQPVMLPTALLSTHTGGLGTPARLATEGWCSAALDHYHSLEMEFDCIYSGYLASEAQVSLVEKAFDLWPRAIKVVDPVMGDGGKLYSGLTPGLCQALRRLCSRADLVVPNLTEACFLLDEPMPSQLTREQAQALAARLGEQYPAAVVTGLPVGRFLMNAGVQKGRSPFTVQRVKIGRSYPGTGDLFGSILVGALLEGQALSAAADLAADFVADAIAATPEEADSRYGVQFEPMLGRLAKR